jgi:hypothetical protein
MHDKKMNIIENEDDNHPRLLSCLNLLSYLAITQPRNMFDKNYPRHIKMNVMNSINNAAIANGWDVSSSYYMSVYIF